MGLFFERIRWLMQIALKTEIYAQTTSDSLFRVIILLYSICIFEIRSARKKRQGREETASSGQGCTRIAASIKSQLILPVGVQEVKQGMAC